MDAGLLWALCVR